MSGTIEGGRKAAAKNIAKDPNFYCRIGKIGGSRSSTGGYATKSPCNCSLIAGEHTKPQCSGKKGGLISKKPNSNK